MYTEGYDELSEAENRPQRHYVSSIPHSDNSKLQREIDRLKKSLEKEQFFNKLLDQELQDVKSLQSNRSSYDPYWYGTNTGVSKGAFYSLLLVTLVLAGFIAYTLYNNKQYNLFQDQTEAVRAKSVSGSLPAAAAGGAEAGKEGAPDKTEKSANNKKASAIITPLASRKIEGVTGRATTPDTRTAFSDNTSNTGTGIDAQKNQGKTNANNRNNQPNGIIPSGSLTDSVPNIIANGNMQPQNSAAVNLSQPSGLGVPAASGARVDPFAGNIIAPPPVPDTRPVIATYKVSSKANFYSSPDENTLRSTFIAQGNNKTVNALDDKNGFIYVEYTNDLGYLSKGWLSKADLIKVK